MLIKNISFSDIPVIQLSDTVKNTLDLMQEFCVTHLPVVEHKTFCGIVSEQILQAQNSDELIKNVVGGLPLIAVEENQFFLEALKLIKQFQLTIIPVINSQKEYIACISQNNILNALADFLQVSETGAVIVLEVDSFQYSFNEIIKIIETNDAQVLQLNTQQNTETGSTTIVIKVNKLEVSDIVATFQRYDYYIKYYFGEELYKNELKSNYDNLMNYLQV